MAGTVVPAAGALSPGDPVPIDQSEAVVGGSVDQVYVMGADPGTPILLDGLPSGSVVNSSGGGLVRGVGGPAERSVEVEITVDGDQASGTVTVYPADVAGQPIVPQSTIFVKAFDADEDGVVSAGEVTQFPTDIEGVPERQGYITTSDGTELSYRVEVPAAEVPEGGFPTLVFYSGYRPGMVPGQSWDERAFASFVAEGFAVVGVNMRGTGCSGGAFDVMEPLVGRDGYDVVETVARQDWVANGKVGMVGASWPGLSQLWVAQHQPPSLGAIAPGAVITDFYRDVVYPGGVLAPAFAVAGWGAERDRNNQFDAEYRDDDNQPIPLHSGGEFGERCDQLRSLRHENKRIQDDFVHPDNATFNDYWAQRTVDVSRITAPTLIVQSWHDEQTASRVAPIIDDFAPTTIARMIGVPEMHGAYEVDSVEDEVSAFLHAYLDGTAQDRDAQVARPRLDVWLQGEDRYLALDELEPQHDPATQDFVLGDDGPAGQRLYPESADSETTTFAYEVGPQLFQTQALSRDVANFTSDPLGQPVVMAGPGSIDLNIRTDADELDLEVNLIEVRADGEEMLISSGWARATHTMSALEGESTPLRPVHAHAGSATAALTDTWFEIRVELFSFAHEFSAGSRIKLQVGGVQGGGQPRWSVEGAPEPGTQVTIGHGVAQGVVRASTAVLPVRTGAQVVDGQGQPVGPPSPPDCRVLVPGDPWAFLLDFWWPCRPSSQVVDLTASPSGPSVTLDWDVLHPTGGTAELLGPVLGSGGEVTEVTAVPTQGPITVTAPPGDHRYTVRYTNDHGITASDTAQLVRVPLVRGSVDQVYVLHADPGTPILLDGTARGVVNASGSGLVREVGRATTGPVEVAITVNGAPVTETVVVYPPDEDGQPTVPQEDVFRDAFDADEDGVVSANEVTELPTVDGTPVRQGYLTTSDGTELSYRVDLPSTTVPPGGFPTLVLYSGYQPSLVPGEVWDEVVYDTFVPRGFAVVGVNMRGTGCSGGAFDVMEPLVGRDGYDVVETIARQDWVASGKVGMVGSSWPGLSQLWVAQHQPPSLGAIAPGAVVSDFYRDVVYPGGVFERAFVVDWWGKGRDDGNRYVDPVHPGDAFGERCDELRSLRHENRLMELDFTDPDNAMFTDYWAQRVADVSKIEAPTLLVQSWHDEQTGSRASAIIDQFDDGTTARMLALDALHGAYTYFPDVVDEVSEFLHAYLVGTPQDRADQEARPLIDLRLQGQRSADLDRLEPQHDPAVHDFTLGEDGAPGRRLLPEQADAATSSFRYEVGVQAFTTGQLDRDVASFTSEALEDPILMAGPGSVDLSIRTDAAAPDLEANLIEVRTDGKELLVTSGWLAATHGLAPDGSQGSAFRPLHGHEPGQVPESMPADTWTQVRVELFPFAHEFAEGSRIKIQIGGVQGGGQPFWSPIGRPDPGKHVTIGHGLDDGQLRVSKAVLPVRPDVVVVDADGQPAAAPGLRPCTDPSTVSGWGLMLLNWWWPCRPAATVVDLTASVEGTEVTLDWTSVNPNWVAELIGPVLTEDGAVIHSTLVPANGPWTVTAPPGRHRYTVRFTNAHGVTGSATTDVVDVAGLVSRELHLPSQPGAPLQVSWVDTADHYWVSLNGTGLHGWVPLTTNQVSIPAALLTPTGNGDPHVVRVVACRTDEKCDSEVQVHAGLGGTVTMHVEPGATLTGRQDGSSLIATVTEPGGRMTNYYAPVGGIVLPEEVTTVGNGERLASLLVPSSDVMTITVG